MTVPQLYRPTDENPRRKRPPQPVRIDEAVGIYRAYMIARVDKGTYSRKSFDCLRGALDRFLDEFGDWPIEDLRQCDFVTWLQSVETWKCAGSGLHRMGMIVACFRWLEDHGLINECKIRRAARLWAPARPRQAITPEQYAAIMDAARIRRPPRYARPERGIKRASRYRGDHMHRTTARAFRRAMAFLWETGARFGEMASLCWSDVDLDLRVAVLQKHKTSYLDGRERTIALSKKAVRLLRWMKRTRKPSEFDNVFLNGRGRPWHTSMFAHAFRRRAKLVGIPKGVSAYSVRHGFCVRALEAGLGTRQTADLMGQATTRMVDWYGKSTRNKAPYLLSSLDAIEKKANTPDEGTDSK